MATLLSMATEALEDIGSIVIPTYLVGNPDDTAKQLIAIAKKVGRELMRDHTFQELIATATVTTVDGTAYYDLEADYDRMVSDTTWDSTKKRRMFGNTTSGQWAAITNSAVQVSVTHWFRLKAGKIYLTPTPDSAFSFDYEYMSKYYCKSTGGTPKAEWTADDDEPRLPYDLFIAGILYYFQKANNLPYADAEAEYNAIIGRRADTNVPSSVIDLGARVQRSNSSAFPLNIPDRVDD